LAVDLEIGDICDAQGGEIIGNVYGGVKMLEAENSSAETYVSFRICAQELDFDDISGNLHLTPDQVNRYGEHPRGNPRYAPYKQAMWSIDSKLPLT